MCHYQSDLMPKTRLADAGNARVTASDRLERSAAKEGG